MLVKDNGECACHPDGRGNAFGGLVRCSVNCDNENEGCGAITGEIVYPACVTYDKDTSLVVAGFCPAALWAEKKLALLP